MPSSVHGTTEPDVLPQFDKDIRDLHLIYDYDAHDSNGKPENWRYEISSQTRELYTRYRAGLWPGVYITRLLHINVSDLVSCGSVTGLKMDPVTAIGLASSVVQFVQFTSSLTSQANRIFKSAEGQLSEHIECSESSKRLEELSDKVKISMQEALSSDNKPTTNDQALEDICNGCIEVSGELQKILGKIRIENNSESRTRRKWRSFREALRSVWSIHDIERLKSRLSSFRDELDIHLVLSIRDNAVSLTKEQAKGFTALETSLKQLANKPVLCKEDLWAQNAELLQDSAAEHEKTRVTILAAMSEREVLNVQEVLLHSLKFSQMRDRYEEIPEAHIQTFKWIFDDSPMLAQRWSNLVNWLEHGKGVYWVCGKAGSGKSTLMRYIYDNPRTLKHLKNWSGGTKLDTGAFFFWNSGNNEQRSHIGLLKSLLYEVLKKRANLLPEIFPEEWSEFCSTVRQAGSSAGRWEFADRKWTLTSLKKGFLRLANFDIAKSNQCFFIDGLDEYEGDHEIIVDFLKTLSMSSHIKFCLSSRPWLLFEDAFKRYPGLRLQDLTFNDIKSYVAHELEGHDRMRKLAMEEPGHASELVKEIVSKAAGVFLWVKLVVRELLRGLRNRDDISDLRTRLHALPSELERFYAHMLKQIEPLYRHQAFRTFQIYNTMRQRWGRVCPHELYIAVLTSFKQMKETPLEQMCDDEIQQRCGHMEDYLKSRCAGLLEIHNTSDISEPLPPEACMCYSLKVDYLHQTAREFLDSEEAKAMMLQGTSSDISFEPNAQILMSVVMSLKGGILNCRRLFEPGGDDDLALDLYDSALNFAVACDDLRVAHYVSILEALDEACSFWGNKAVKKEAKDIDYLPHLTPPYEHWSEKNRTVKLPEQQGSGFLGVAVQNSLLFYVSRKLKSNRDIFYSSERARQALLNCALAPEDSGCPIFYSKTGIKMLGLLLKHGASPNTPWQGHTPWQRALFLVHDFDWENRIEDYGYDEVTLGLRNWLSVFKMLLQHGASPTTTCIQNHPVVGHKEALRFTSHRVADVIRDIFGKRFPQETAQLLQLVNDLQESQKMARAKRSPPGHSRNVPNKKMKLGV